MVELKQKPVSAANIRVWSLTLLVSFLGAVATLIYALGLYLENPAHMPLKHIEIRGKFIHLEQDHLRKLIGQSIRGFFTTNLDEVRNAALGSPWIDEVRVRRIWPDKLLLEVNEKELFARWDQDRMLSSRGEVFKPLRQPNPQPSLRLYGQDERAKEVMARYWDATKVLTPHGLSIRSFGVDARGEWRIEMENGLLVIMGNQDAMARLKRLLENFDNLKGKSPEPEIIDLRYEQGFAVRWKSIAQQGSDA